MNGPGRIGLAFAGAVVMLSLAAPSFAQQDIPWTWNNDSDRDARAMFESTGEHLYAYEYEGNDYVDYDPPGTSEQRWYIPGSEDRTQKDNNLSYDEGLAFSMQVCETKTLAPDDCSNWRSGVT